MLDSYDSDDSCSKSVEYDQFDYENSGVEEEESYIQKLDYERAPKEDIDDISDCKLLCINYQVNSSFQKVWCSSEFLKSC